MVATFNSKHVPAGMSNCASPARHPGVNHAWALALQLWVQVCGETYGEQREPPVARHRQKALFVEVPQLGAALFSMHNVYQTPGQRRLISHNHSATCSKCFTDMSTASESATTALAWYCDTYA